MPIKFVSYTGKYPNLCSGDLTLEIDGKRTTFGLYKEPIFWCSGGRCYFSNNGDKIIEQGNWIVYKSQLPEKLQEYSEEIEELLNKNIPKGCCGGCI